MNACVRADGCIEKTDANKLTNSRKTDAYKLTDSQKTDAYELTDSQKTDAYKLMNSSVFAAASDVDNTSLIDLLAVKRGHGNHVF